ncbi:MAG: redox-regulated ATPase YchF, partial [Anaerolineae bacterium]|nr:redox-regulated ATPase YchF [Anaerolineae bacterium]
LRFELIFSDLALVEARIERMQNGLLKRGPQAAALQAELALMQRLREALEAGTPISELDLTDDEGALIRGFQFLSAKPSLVTVNLSEDAELPDLSWANHRRNNAALALKGALEKEIAQLPREEVLAFLQSYGIVEPSLHLLVRECYRLLGLISFFTVGEDEVRAWTVRRGATALEAARAIHSDLARGFIRAEVVAYEDLVALGGLPEARRAGKWRLEGKDYVVQDGDVLSIRFNV